MTIQECIDRVDSLKPNQYTVKEKVEWLSFIELRIINDVLKTHEGYDGRYDLFTGYSEDKLTITMIAPSPYDIIYTKYLEMKIDEANGETTRYNNSATMFNTYYADYKKYYNKEHMPLDPLGKADKKVPTTAKVGLTDAEYDSLVKDLTYKLTEYFSASLSNDKIYEIVNAFVLNNIQMLKGKDGRDGIDGKDGYTPRKNIDYFDGKKGDNGDPGYTPQRGIDYFTDADKSDIREYINSRIPMPDYNQNDATHRDYIKNRPFYEGETVVLVDVVEEDGTTGIDEQHYYSVDKTVIMPGTIVQFELYGGDDTYGATKVIEENDPFLQGDWLIDEQVHAFSVKLTETEIVLNTPIMEYFTFKLTVQTPDKPLDEKFIPDSIARKSDVEALIGTANAELESILAGGVD